jgi:hypothetical protein
MWRLLAPTKRASSTTATNWSCSPLCVLAVGALLPRFRILICYCTLMLRMGFNRDMEVLVVVALGT